MTLLAQNSLPSGWLEPVGDQLRDLDAEYRRELPSQHPLAGIRVATVAVCLDDILLRRLDDTDRFSVVHLTWSMRVEQPNYPSLEFTGSFEEFEGWARASEAVS